MTNYDEEWFRASQFLQSLIELTDNPELTVRSNEARPWSTYACYYEVYEDVIDGLRGIRQRGVPEDSPWNSPEVVELEKIFQGWCSQSTSDEGSIWGRQAFLHSSEWANVRMLARALLVNVCYNGVLAHNNSLQARRP